MAPCRLRLAPLFHILSLALLVSSQNPNANLDSSPSAVALHGGAGDPRVNAAVGNLFQHLEAAKRRNPFRSDLGKREDDITSDVEEALKEQLQYEDELNSSEEEDKDTTEKKTAEEELMTAFPAVDKRPSRFRSDLGKRRYRADLGKRGGYGLTTNFGKRLFLTRDLGKRAGGFDEGDLAVPVFGGVDEEESSMEMGGQESGGEEKRARYRSDLGKRNVWGASGRRVFRADLGKRRYRADLG